MANRHRAIEHMYQINFVLMHNVNVLLNMPSINMVYFDKLHALYMYPMYLHLHDDTLNMVHGDAGGDGVDDDVVTIAVVVAVVVIVPLLLILNLVLNLNILVDLWQDLELDKLHNRHRCIVVVDITRFVNELNDLNKQLLIVMRMLAVAVVAVVLATMMAGVVVNIVLA